MQDEKSIKLDEALHKIKSYADDKHPPYLAEAMVRFRIDHDYTQARLAEHIKKEGMPISESAIKSYETCGSYPHDKKLKKLAGILGVTFEKLKYGVDENLRQAQRLTGLSPTALANLEEFNKATPEAFQKETENVYAQGDLKPSLLDAIPRGNETKVINWILEDRSFLILLSNKVSAIKIWTESKQTHGEYFAPAGDDLLDGAKARIQRDFLSLIEKRVEEELNNGRKKENKKR